MPVTPRITDRRNFLGLTAATAVGIGLSAGRSSLFGQDEPAITAPVVDSSVAPAQASPYFPKLSLAAYSFRDQLQGKTKPAMTLEQFVDYCAAQGLEGTELTGYYFPEPLDLAYLRAIRRRAFRAGLTVSGTAVGNDFGVTDPDQLKQQIAHVKSWCDYAAEMTAPVIRIFAGHVPTGADEAATLNQMATSIEECCEYAGERGVHLALENHGGPTATADGLIAICDRVKSDWFGVNLDTGNFRSPDPYADIARVIPRALNVQIKLSITPTTPDGKSSREPSDLPRVGKLLREGGYRGFVVLEYEEPHDPYAEVPTALVELRQALIAT